MDIRKVRAFSRGHGYRFHRHENPPVTERIGHVRALLGLNGYRLSTWGDGYPVSWFFMHFSEYKVSEPVLPDPNVEIKVEFQLWSGRPDLIELPTGGDLPNLSITVFRDDCPIGYGESWSAG